MYSSSINNLFQKLILCFDSINFGSYQTQKLILQKMTNFKEKIEINVGLLLSKYIKNDIVAESLNVLTS